LKFFIWNIPPGVSITNIRGILIFSITMTHCFIIIFYLATSFGTELGAIVRPLHKNMKIQRILCAVLEHCVCSIFIGHVNKENYSSSHDLWGSNKKNFSCSHDLWRWHRQSVLKHWRIEFRCRGITQKKAHNIHNMVKVWNQVWTNLRVLKTLIIPLLKNIVIVTRCVSAWLISESVTELCDHFWHP